MKQKRAKLEFIKSESDVNFIANLILNLCRDHNERFVLLKGDIGSGKTTLVKEIAKILGEKETVISPSFNKMFVYNDFVHIDAYNFTNESIDDWDEYLDDKLVIIEWFENLNTQVKGLVIKIDIINDNQRKYTFEWKD